jgi:hypothetical protein
MGWGHYAYGAPALLENLGSPPVERQLDGLGSLSNTLEQALDSVDSTIMKVRTFCIRKKLDVSYHEDRYLEMKRETEQPEQAS